MRNSSYSFMPIGLILYRCFSHGLKMCIQLGYNPHKLSLLAFYVVYYYQDINVLTRIFILLHVHVCVHTLSGGGHKFSEFTCCFYFKRFPQSMYSAKVHVYTENLVVLTLSGIYFVSLSHLNA